MAYQNAHVLLGDDFNCGNVEWGTMLVPDGVPQRHVQCRLFELIKEHCLSKVIKIPTFHDRILDHLFTNPLSSVNRVKGMPP